MKRLCLNRLKSAPIGYLDDGLTLGTVRGGILTLSDGDYMALRAKYSPGLGDRVARVAKPIARAIDGVLGTDLENCESCEERRKRLNELSK